MRKPLIIDLQAPLGNLIIIMKDLRLMQSLFSDCRKYFRLWPLCVSHVNFTLKYYIQDDCLISHLHP